MNHISLGIGSEGCMRDASDPIDEEGVVEEPEDLINLNYLHSK